ncbi:inositol monophosphatase family protein [Actinosynnema sp. NPDC020468]|uniref:inositol monophosphatase family protein n=1 Tax=Actinosynnema sp. NPDC020468 TaxID=3154488 RepID=UPI0033F12149
MRSLDQSAKIAESAVRMAGDLLENSRPQVVTAKADRDTFTDIDVLIERKIRSYLADATPDIAFLGEEEGYSNQVTDSGYTWVLDPVDGTANFVHGVPLSAVSLALVNDNTAVVGVISLPRLHLTYTAVQGGGAYVNGQPISVSGVTELSGAMVAIGDYATGTGAEEKNTRRIALTTALAGRVERIRMFGSAAHDLVWLAEGRVDAALILANEPWDVAAGVLIAREAGALVVDASGATHDSQSADTIAATPAIVDQLLAIIPA